MSVTTTVNELKQNDQDFEWYPTSPEMIKAIQNDYFAHRGTRQSDVSILDIGAGDGRVLELFSKEIPTSQYVSFKKYAIEKSRILIEKMPDDIFVIGSDFYQQTLMDKKVDIIFCNPPYSVFSEWLIKIVEEANANWLYFVVPKRWANNEELQDTIKNRDGKVKVIGEYSFRDADRKARVDVDIIRIQLTLYRNDPFNTWFDKHFDFNIAPKKVTEEETAQSTSSVMDKDALIPSLVYAYEAEMNKLMSTFKSFNELDGALLHELGISVVDIRESLRKKIEGLKNKYWKELFESLDKLRERLTKKTRERLFNKLNESLQVDFTEENVYAVVIWAIKNSNKYFSEQLISVYDDLTQSENVVNYKSNKNIIEGNWRYCRVNDKYSHYRLDYRLVHHFWGAIKDHDIFRSWDYEKNLNKGAHEFINDLFIIARNLGFTIQESTYDFDWESRKKCEFHLKDGELFAEIRAYKNGNIHFKLCQGFMKKFNVEAGRLKGWIKKPEDAQEELGLTKDESIKYFGSNLTLGGNISSLLLTE